MPLSAAKYQIFIVFEHIFAFSISKPPRNFHHKILKPADNSIRISERYLFKIIWR